MNVKETFRTLLGLPPRKSVLIESGHGLGKSQIVAQAAAAMSKKLGKTFGFIDIRLSQREVGDLIGMPRGMEKFTVTHKVFKDGIIAEESMVASNVTIYDLPHWFPQDPDSSGYLFLDELNRATREVQQAAFELALDYRLNFHTLPLGWRVIAAINDNMDVYSVLSVDPALYDRFLKIKFKPTVPEWLEHAESIGVHRAIMTYINKFTSDLDTPEKIETGTIYPSRRSWVQLSDCIKYMTDNKDDPLKDLDYLTLLASGYLGSSVAINFVEYVRNNYRVFSAEDILDKYTKEMEEAFKDMTVPEVTFYSKEIIRWVKEQKLTKLTKKQSDNLLKFLKAIPKEAASGFWGQATTDIRDVTTAWYKGTTGAQDYIYGFLSKEQSLKGL